jgi:uncharacterized protein
MLPFIWDETKAASNVRKHGVSFDQAARAFDDPGMTFLQDETIAYGEVRMIAIGLMGMTLLTIVFTERGDAVRIISARRSNRQEERIYAEAC